MSKFIILINDDEKEILNLLEESLDMTLGYKILTSNSGEDGLSILKEKSVGLLITDFRMPKMTGGELVQTLRSNPGPNQNIPIIFFSAYVDEAIKDTKGIHKIYYIEKPIILADLVRTIDQALSEEQES